jgi:carbamoyltransferase
VTLVLGISAFYHDAAACLLRDGEIVMAVAEERLSRVLHDHAYPERAVAACLEAAGASPADVDAVVFYEKTFPKLERQLETWTLAWPRSFGAFVRGMSRYLDGRVDLVRWLAKKGFEREILMSEHHLSHAALAFHASPFDAATVLVADGVGEWATTTTWDADADGIRPVREVSFPDSLGLFYSLVTAHLGFRVNEDEYKVMGLAAYGKDAFEAEMRRVLVPGERGAFTLARGFLDLTGSTRGASAELSRLLGPPREPGAPIEDRHRDVAHSAQKRLEEALLALEAVLPAGKPLCFSGGVALNGVANARLAERRELFVPYAPGDSGGAVGAALVGHAALTGRRPPRCDSPFLGPAFDVEACRAAAHEAGSSARPLAELGGDAYVATRLAAGAILGLFDGRMELGPRALGARSILADPRREEVRDLVNARVKKREAFRPFAPAILAERAAGFFEDTRPARYMETVRVVRPERRAEIAAVVHVDGTARAQLVQRAEVPRLHAIIAAFEEKTGVPALLNTSFNVAGEPIVCTPGHALYCMQRAGLDGLVLGDLWVEGPGPHAG